MKRWSDGASKTWNLFPKKCWIERAVVITVTRLDSSYDCVETCGFIDKLADEGHARIVLDVSDLERIPGAFYGFIRSLCRRHLKKGNRIIVVGPAATDLDSATKSET